MYCGIVYRKYKKLLIIQYTLPIQTIANESNTYKMLLYQNHFHTHRRSRCFPKLFCSSNY
jgi:hypothetical protein